MMKVLAWIGAVAIFTVVAVAIFTGLSSDDEGPRAGTTESGTKAPQSVTMPFERLSKAHRARGTITVKTDDKPRLDVTIDIVSPHRRYAVSLWNNKIRAKGLYAGYPGRNIQSFRIFARRLVRYRWINIGRQVIHMRDGQVVNVKHRNMLRISTNRLLNGLLAP